MSRWRWPSWAMVGLTVGYLLIAALRVATMGDDAYGAGQSIGALAWPYVIGMVVLGVIWKRTVPKPCPSCGRPVPSGAAMCPSCGTRSAAATLGACPQCGQLVYVWSASCPRCGYVPGQLQPPQAPPTPPPPPTTPVPPAGGA